MDMPISILLLLCLIFFIIGLVTMLLLQYYVYWKLSILPDETDVQKDINARYSLPSVLRDKAKSVSSDGLSLKDPSASSTTNLDDSESLVSINFVTQFLFHELKNSNLVRKWFYRKLSIELDELIAKTTTGKLFDKLTVKELELGEQFPEIKMLRVHNVKLDDKEGRIENLDLLLLLHYKGNFRTTIDADMVLGKKGSLTLKVRQLSGLARLQFTRTPYTHWSLSFLGDPELDLAIESKYQGRQMQSNITSFISNQIRKAIRRKHTLPNYKLRYKPFFHKTLEEEINDTDFQPNGTLAVKISEISRLLSPSHFSEIYCTLTMASLPFVEARQKDDRNVIVSLNVEIHKAKNQQIGIVFKQVSEYSVQIDGVLPNTPAFKSNLLTDDIIIAIEDKKIQTIQQIAKVVRGLQSSVFNLRIERVISGIIRNDAILEDLEMYEDFGDLYSGYGPNLKLIEAEVPVKGRQSSAEKGTSSESSIGNTPTSSPKKSKLIAKALKKSISRDIGDKPNEDEKLKGKFKIDQKREIGLKLSGDKFLNDVEHFYQHSTIDCKVSNYIHMEDLSIFKLDSNSKYLNVCVYGKCSGDSALVGYVNIPIYQVLAECMETSLSCSLKTCELHPPIPDYLKSHPLSNQSGFNPNMCFGDLLISFTWDGSPNLSSNETSSTKAQRMKPRHPVPSEKSINSSVSDGTSIKSTEIGTPTPIICTQTKSHNFIRKHFQRATQCDYCGKKIWLKDAVQCKECLMCCHKKCITKCQNYTVCGPVDCSSALTAAASNSFGAPDFVVTQADAAETSEAEDVLNITEEEINSNSNFKNSLEAHRSSLTGLLAQGIKRVNSANNLAIPGIVSSITGSNSENVLTAKSLPPSPQSSPSRKPSLVIAANPFDMVTKILESIAPNISSLSVEEIDNLTIPIKNIPKDEDVMLLAKNGSKNLYADIQGSERVDKINVLLSKLRLALDSETATHSTLTVPRGPPTTGSPPTLDNKSAEKAMLVGKSEERVQALSVIMLYLCTGLQHAQGVAQQ